MIRLDPDSELAKDMKKLKETENLDHVLLHLLFEVHTYLYDTYLQAVCTAPS